MLHYGKYKGRKASKTPTVIYKQEPINIPIKQFIDSNSSIRYDTQMDNQKFESVNSPYENRAYHTISSHNIYTKPAHNYSSAHLKSVQENVHERSFDIEQQDMKLRKCNSRDLSKSGRKSAKAISIANMNEKIYQNQQQVVKISIKAQEVSDQLLMMKNFRQTLPDQIHRYRDSSIKSRLNKSPSIMSSSSKNFMNPTESHKIKSLGKITSKQRILEVLEFLESGQKQKTQQEKKKKTIKSVLKPKPNYMASTGTVNKKNKTITQESTKQSTLIVRPKSQKITRPQPQQRRTAPTKTRLFIDPPQNRRNENTEICIPRNQSQGSQRQITYNSLTQEQSFQQYIDCRNEYLKKMNQDIEPSKRKQTTQDLVHQRVKQMQNNYHEVFKMSETIKEKDKPKSENNVAKTTPKVNKHPIQNLVSPKNWNLQFKTTDMQKERTYKQLRNQIGNSYMCQFKKGKPQKLSNIVNSPSNVITKNQSKYETNRLKLKCSKRQSICNDIKISKIQQNEVHSPSIIDNQNQRINTVYSYYNEEDNRSDMPSFELQYPQQRMVGPMRHSMPMTIERESPPMKPQLPIKVFKRSAQLSKQNSAKSSPLPQRKSQPIQKSSQSAQQKEQDDKLQIMQSRLKYLHSNFGAVIIGYKTRRIFHNNINIRKIRLEFREIIQFAYTLKNDIKDKGMHHSQELKHLLFTSLKELMQKRQLFAALFHNLLHSHNTQDIQWIKQSKPPQIQQFEYNNVFIRKDRNSNQYLNTIQQGRTDPKNLSKHNKSIRSQSQENMKLRCSKYLNESYKSLQDNHLISNDYSLNQSKMLSASHHRFRKLISLDHIDNQTPKQMTFGHNSIKQSRNMSMNQNPEADQSCYEIPEAKDSPAKSECKLSHVSPIRKFNLKSDQPTDKLNQTQTSNKSKQMSDTNSQASKHKYLRKGSNLRQMYDPRKSLERDKEVVKQKKQLQIKQPISPQSPKIIENEQPKLVKINQVRNSRQSKFISTPIKEQNYKHMEKLSAQRLSDLREKYSAKKTQTGLTSTSKQRNMEDEKKETKTFVSKIPRLSCSNDRSKLNRSKSSIKINNYGTRYSIHSNINIETSKDFNQSFMKEEINNNDSQKGYSTKKPYLNMIMHNGQLMMSQKSVKSNSSFLTQQIPVVSPSCIRVNNFEDKESLFQVQINPSIIVSEIVSKLQSPQRRSSIPELQSKMQNNMNQLKRSFKNKKYSISPIKSTINLETNTQIKQGSPAISISNHMDKIYQRCSTLKQTQFVNNYLEIQDEMQDGHYQFKKDVLDINQAHEIKLFSPEPQPAELKVNMVPKDSQQQLGPLSTSSLNDPINLQEQVTFQAQDIQQLRSGKLDIDYKLMILELENQKKEIEMFDNYNFNGITSQSILFQSNKSRQHDSGSTFRLLPEQVIYGSFQSGQSKQKLSKQDSPPIQSPYKRVKNSPQKSSLSKNINKENIVEQMLSTIAAKKENNVRRRSRGDRAKRTSIIKSITKPLNIGYQQTEDNILVNTQIINDTHQSRLSYKQDQYQTPKQQTSTGKKYERYGYLKKSNSKSPHCSILEQKNMMTRQDKQVKRQETSGQLPESRQQATLSTQGSNMKANNKSQYYDSFAANDQPLNLKLNFKHVYQRMM